jgi:hypothetical protein
MDFASLFSLSPLWKLSTPFQRQKQIQHTKLCSLQLPLELAVLSETQQEDSSLTISIRRFSTLFYFYFAVSLPFVMGHFISHLENTAILLSKAYR